ncbi:MAG: tRNA-(ms[2]io[6]A)-hydroxylase [Flavobacteriales bacterium]|jgi:tRNA-(ms[2]io[6]A)-hydroxylase
MSQSELTREIHEFLLCKTPQPWIDRALREPEILLVDHANCEKKAASTAMNLMYRYVDNFELLNLMSKLAREELRHFEQVIAIMNERKVPYEQITASRYAAQLRKTVRTYEPAKLIDTLIIGAIIEARSCERFEALAPHLDDVLGSFYMTLLKSESRHFKDYLHLATKAADGEDISERVQHFLLQEKALILEPDTEFRFHSGPVHD